MNLLPNIMPRNDTNNPAAIDRRLINAESQIGSRLFGPIPKGHKRQFFCLDEYTWIWYEEWSENGKHRAVTTRYEVRPNGIIKLQDGQPSQILSISEADNLYKAAYKYCQLVDAAYREMLAAY